MAHLEAVYYHVRTLSDTEFKHDYKANKVTKIQEIFNSLNKKIE